MTAEIPYFASDLIAIKCLGENRLPPGPRDNQTHAILQAALTLVAEDWAGIRVPNKLEKAAEIAKLRLTFKLPAAKSEKGKAATQTILSIWEATETGRPKQLLELSINARADEYTALIALTDKYCPSHIGWDGRFTKRGKDLLRRKKVHAEDFLRWMEKDPQGCLILTQQLEVVGSCNLSLSPITELSPLLYFKDKVTLDQNKTIRELTGNFAAGLTAINTKLQKVAAHILGRVPQNSEAGLGANFLGSKDLMEIEGTFEYPICLSHTGIQTVKNCKILHELKAPTTTVNPIPIGTKAILTHCPNLDPEPYLLKKEFLIDPELRVKIQRRQIAEKMRNQPTCEI